MYKYLNFVVANINEILKILPFHIPPLTPRDDIVLPVGISFFVFETLSYTVDVYRGTFKPIRKFAPFAMFVSFFPHLVAGPVVRAKDFLPQVEGNFKENVDESGIFLILFGFAKKLLLADVLASLIVDPVFAQPENYSALQLILAVYCYSFQIFLDFSGYTDIAIGIAKLLGFDLGLNFNAPYISRSFAEFWNRWHISLSHWFRDYVYILLGGNRVKTTARLYFNMGVVFFLSGLWHGASWKFVVWGLLNGAYLIVEAALTSATRDNPLLRRASTSVAWRIGKTLLVFNGISLAWIFFRASSISQAWFVLTRIATGLLSATATQAVIPTRAYKILVICALLHIAIEPYRYRLARWFSASPLPLRVASAMLLFMGIFDGSLGRIGHKAFIYFQF